MKWFKHLVGSGSDPDIEEAIELFGSDGYYVFFRVLEVMSREFKLKTPGFNDFSYKFLRRKLKKNRQKVERILKFFDKKDRIKIEFYKEGKQERIKLYCPKLKELCDEYTQKKLALISGQDRDSIGIHSVSDQDQDQESDLSITDQSKPAEADFEGKESRHYSAKVGGFLDSINNQCRTLDKMPKKNDQKFNPWQAVQMAVNENAHPEAIVTVQAGMIKQWSYIKKPMGYWTKSIKHNSAKFNERDHIKQSDEFKQAWNLDPRLKKLVRGIG